jgi:alpha-beta hydrolase superfamily lysophospholipase
MAGHDEGFFNAKDGLRLFWQSDLPAAPRAHVAMVHGFGDHSGRYGSLRKALVDQGFAAHGFDYRGHGRADGQRGHVDRFTDYVADLERFWERVREGAGALPTFVFAHSHGGLIAVHFALRAPAALKGLVLSTPFLGFAFTPPPLKVAGAKVVGFFWPNAPFKSMLKAHELTRDPELQEATRKDPLYHTAVTPRWFDEEKRAQSQARDAASRLALPVFLYAGSSDPIASVPTARLFFEHLGSADKQYKEYPGMLHESFNELGRAEVERDVANWISLHV